MKLTFDKIIIGILVVLSAFLTYNLNKANAVNKAMLRTIEGQKEEIKDLNSVITKINEELYKYMSKQEEQKHVQEDIKQAEAHLGDNEAEAIASSGGYFMTCRITHYSSEETGSNVTASGEIAQLDHTIACNILPFGTQVCINGIVYTVEDTGDMDGNGIDIYVSCSAEAFERGTYITEVEVL